jgi:hypothetical protein
MYEDKGHDDKGHDLQELWSRVERLEATLASPTCMGMRGTGIAQVGEKYYSAASISSDTKPMTWQADEPSRVPPLFKAMLGLPPHAQIDSAQSKSWHVIPDPLIQNVLWHDDGRIEEYFRFQDQLVTLTQFTDPTTGPAAVVNYTATVVASGRAKPGFGASNAMLFVLDLQNVQGGFLYEPIRAPFAIGCYDHGPFNGIGGRFPPTLYDIADSFHFHFEGNIRLVHC